MKRHTHTRPRYTSDLSDNQWRTIEILIPPERDRGRHRSTDLREVVNGINYRWSTGCVWRMLPHDFPPWATVYTYFRRWQHEGTLKELRDALLSCRGAPREPGLGDAKATQRCGSRRQEVGSTIDDTSDPDRWPTSDQFPVPVVGVESPGSNRARLTSRQPSAGR